MISTKYVKYDEAVPYISIGKRATIYCQHGKDKHVTDKQKYAAKIKVSALKVSVITCFLKLYNFR